MKLINAAIVAVKLILSLAGIVLVVNKITEALNNNQYKFNVDSLLNNNDEKAIKQKSKVAKAFGSRYMKNVIYESMDA